MNYKLYNEPLSMLKKIARCRIFLISIMIVTSSMAGCLGTEDSTSESTSESSDCDNGAPWLFVLNGGNVTIDLTNDSVHANDSANGANMSIYNEVFYGPVVAYTEAVEGEMGGGMQVIDNHFATLAMLASENKNGAITGFMDDGGEVTVTFSLISVYNNTSIYDNDYNESNGTLATAQLIGVNDNNGEMVEGTSFHLNNASYLIDSWWCEVIIAVAVTEVIQLYCAYNAWSCIADVLNAEDTEDKAITIAEDVAWVIDELGYGWGANTINGLKREMIAAKGWNFAEFLWHIIDYICDEL